VDSRKLVNVGSRKLIKDFGRIGITCSGGDQQAEPTRSPIVRINSAGALKIFLFNRQFTLHLAAFSAQARLESLRDNGDRGNFPYLYCEKN
jgi:hypothetical protein